MCRSGPCESLTVHFWLVSTRRKLPCLLIAMGTDTEPGKRQRCEQCLKLLTLS